MRVLGLTGGAGSGKSTVAAVWARHGLPIVDTDEIAHRLTAPQGAAMPSIRDCFGDGVVDENGALDRAAMRAIVFAEPLQRLRLESLLHPLIRDAALDGVRQAAAAGQGLCVLVVPLLFEGAAFRNVVVSSVAVDCPIALQRQRLMARPGIDAAMAERIIATQAPRQLRLQLADHVLSNTRDLDALASMSMDLLAVLQPGK